MKISTLGKYYGELSSELYMDGALLTKYEYDEDHTPWHYHENPYFMYVMHGNMIDKNKKVKNLCPPGSLMFTNWQEIHKGEKHSARAAGLHLELEQKWLEKYNLSLADVEGSLQIANPNIIGLMNRIFAESCINDHHSKSSIELLILDVLNQVKNSPTKNSRRPNWAKRLTEILIDAETNYTLTDLSKELNIHPVHLSREFHKYFGSTLGQYTRQLKLNKAIVLMTTKQFSLTEICYRCGFYDQSHFISNFKSLYKMTPTQYLKLISKC